MRGPNLVQIEGSVKFFLKQFSNLPAEMAVMADSQLQIEMADSQS